MLLYTDLVRDIARDVARRVPDLAHIDADRIAFLAAARCTSHRTGNLAICYGLNRQAEPTFSVWVRRGTRKVIAVSGWVQMRVPRVYINGREMSYLILLRLPRLLRQNPLETIIHELYHISEGFDRRMRPARHGALFDREVRRLMNVWLANARGDLPRLAQMTLRQLEGEFGAVLAQGVPSNFRLPIVEPVRGPESYQRAVPRLYPGHSLAALYQVRPAQQLSPEETPRVLTERDLVLRHYHTRGVERVPAEFTRYSRNGRRSLALSA
ncbi:MAG TPA: hypothetical protein PLS90_03820 [Candidatus Sumerlaeota bacterium]|nr:MAG: hypothetical protein BWZ08_01694 [candidate division BRC1 bacterium ADurb.BinA292]HOE97905.1 hypothetical protein [Candidatus Sumerlaeota bacterium]HOR27309.1 hypothetical protein [Candidatus Sumerlaeota bacterium]HPK01564.1 hypothetical protein [Candidatus Sumerlaeota bacterium]